MSIDNIIQMNDWEIGKFLKFVFSIQIVVLGILGLMQIGIEIPFIKEIFGFIYLTFIPGIIILRILKIHNLGNTKTIVCSVGLSITFLMFTGLFINIIYPLFSISRPISTLWIVLTITLIMIVLSFVSFIMDKDYNPPNVMDLKSVLHPSTLFLCLIPFFAIFGTYLMNFNNVNILLILMIILISIIFLLTTFDKFFRKEQYSFIIFIFAISLLYYRSLISMNLTGYDIQIEYYLSKLVLTNGIWDWNISNTYNGVLSTNILAPIYSIYTGLTLKWVFKIIYPLLYSIVPLGLYKIFQSQTNEKIAFISCFLFMSLFMFYNEMLMLAKQQIAEIFIILMILLIVEKNINPLKKSFLFVFSAFSLVVSHYGLSYIYTFIILSSWIILKLDSTQTIQKMKNKFIIKSESIRMENNYLNFLTNEKRITLNFSLLLMVISFGWYIYVSNSFSFMQLVNVGNHISNNLFTEFLNPKYTEGLNYIVMNLSLSHKITKYVQLIIQFLIGVGLIGCVLKYISPKISNFDKEYIVLSVVNIIMLISAILVPFFAKALNTTRFYHISLIVLSPFFVIGAITICKSFYKLLRMPLNQHQIPKIFKILSIFLVLSFYLNSGIIYEILNDDPTTIMLNNTIDYPRFSDAERMSASWLVNKKGYSVVYSDVYRRFLLQNFDLYESRDISRINSSYIRPNSYLYFGNYNIKNNAVLKWETKVSAKSKQDYINMTEYIVNKNMIYDNGLSEIFLKL
ncbi:MAG: DUF2206 domain-containing protein [Methanobacterium sp.]|jgi:uncharacterized membrane protein